MTTGPRTGQAMNFWRHTAAPATLILLCPPFAMLLWYTHTQLGGSLASLWSFFGEHGALSGLWKIWGPVFFGTPTAWLMIGLFAVTQLALMRIVPGPKHEGPASPSGYVPIYPANGPACFAITMVAFAVGAYVFNLFPGGIIYDNFGGILGALNLFSLLFCLALYLKGRYAPSTPDHGLSGRPVFDYYWGTELHPRILGWDIKQFTNCRFGMMGWAIIVLSFAAKQHEVYGLSDSMAVAAGLQLVYIAKFFVWETGYLRSTDIMHDRAGFYICWGCLVWVPAVYTSASLYLVNHPNALGWPIAVGIFTIGAIAIVINYLADAQRQRFRATQGDCKIWGRPPEMVKTSYTTTDGKTRESLLLASGWWGVSRHFHYVPEVLAAFCWTVPALFHNALPYFYVTFLVILLGDRIIREEKRCAAKYGQGWERYCERVPNQLVPRLASFFPRPATEGSSKD